MDTPEEPKKGVRVRQNRWVLYVVFFAVLFVCVPLLIVSNTACACAGPRAKAQAEIRTLMVALEMYHMKFNEYPASLEALLNNPKGVKFLEQEEIPLDPWNNPYVYTLQSAREFTIVSYGADGHAGGSGYEADISISNLKGDAR